MPSSPQRRHQKQTEVWVYWSLTFVLKSVHVTHKHPTTNKQTNKCKLLKRRIFSIILSDVKIYAISQGRLRHYGEAPSEFYTSTILSARSSSSFFPHLFSYVCMFACICLPMHEVHMCVGCACMCEHVHEKSEVDTENLPQLLSTFLTEAGSSAEPRLSDAASLASHFVLGVMGRLPCPPDFRTGLGIWTLATGPSPQIFTCYLFIFFRHRVYVAQAEFEFVILLSQMGSHAWLWNYFFKNSLKWCT